MNLLAIEWISIGVKTAQFIMSFSILVVLHELGHFIPARIFKCRVEKFYLFFDPWFSIWKKKKGETEYGMGWIPFGGYVKISGMIDESMDKEQMKLPPEPYEFRSKPAWQRLIIMVGGVVVNILLAIVIFIGISWVWGERYLPAKNLQYGVHADSLARSIGIMDGDKIVSLDGKIVEDFGTIVPDIITTDAKKMQVERNGALVDINLPDGLIKNLFKTKKGKEIAADFITMRYPAIVDSVSKAAVFTKGRFQKGDKLIAFNNKPFQFFHEYEALNKGYADSIVTFTVLRAADTVNVKVLLNNKGAVGFFRKTPYEMFGTVYRQYSFAQAIPIGFNRCFETLEKYITGIKQIFTGKVNASESLGSVISIGNTFPGVWDWQKFWTLTGIFSIILAFMNILPIPALDGGHALFTIYEMVTGRKPGDKFMEYAQMFGMVLLLGLMAYALGLDFWRLFK
ncbi:MAG: RIP metalloprotease RseP [Chitinophagaceae bacterium]|nr:RIP metalloprotease RseP [Chitinophagaceae bacterium]